MQCTKCKLDKPKSEFYYFDKKRKYHVWCRPCCAAYAVERRKEKKDAGGFCSNCCKPCAERQCPECQIRPRNKEKMDKRTKRFRIENPNVNKKYDLQRKFRVINAYGGPKCQCPHGCDATAIEFLTIDHINGGGKKHIETVRNFYCWLIRNGFPKGFRVLCMNCNFSLGRYGFCGHERQKTGKIALADGTVLEFGPNGEPLEGFYGKMPPRHIDENTLVE